jgi:magnesium transporter
MLGRAQEFVRAERLHRRTQPRPDGGARQVGYLLAGDDLREALEAGWAATVRERAGNHADRREARIGKDELAQSRGDVRLRLYPCRHSISDPPAVLRDGRGSGPKPQKASKASSAADCASRGFGLAPHAMLAAYTVAHDRLVKLPPGPKLPANAVWIDLLNPTSEEESEVERTLSIDIPTHEEMAEIEVSSRLYHENDALYMTVNLLVGGDGPNPESCPVTFVLSQNLLVTIRYSEPSVFKRLPVQAAKVDSNLRNSDDVFVALLEAIVDRTADILERVGASIDVISREVFRADENGKSELQYRAVLRRLGRSGDVNSKVRESLVSIGRLLHFVSAECGEAHPGLRERAASIAADVRSLADHASYVSGIAVFLLDATLGLINTEQNAIIRIISVLAVLIMPPTLVASIYGMNFRFMPELDWRFGYPMALLAMVAAAVIPYFYFKRRGWL